MSILGECRVNDVVGVRYGDKPEERVCRVLKVRDTCMEPVKQKSRKRRPGVARGRYLVTCQSTTGQVRSFYADQEQSARRIPKLRAAWLYLRGKLPPRVPVAS